MGLLQPCIGKKKEASAGAWILECVTGCHCGANVTHEETEDHATATTMNACTPLIQEGFVKGWEESPP